MNEGKYDLIVIGGGSAGEKGAAQAAYFGKKVALIERSPTLGGAVADTSIPFKALRESAQYLAGFRTRRLQGIEFRLKERSTIRDFISQEQALVRDYRFRVATNLDNHDIDRLPGRASFVDPHTVKVEHPRRPPILLSADVILIAVGSRPYQPPEFDFAAEGIFDSTTFVRANCMPKATRGDRRRPDRPRVRLHHGAARLLGDSARCRRHAPALPRFGDLDPVAAEPDRDRHRPCAGRRRATGERRAALHALPSERARARGGCDPGRRGSDRQHRRAGVENAGLAPDARGLLQVDESFRTAQPHIRAVGDVIGFPALASSSMEQARMAMVHAFDLKYKQRVADLMPYGIYTIPECSMVGATEDSAQRKGIAYVVGRARYRHNARGGIIGDDAGFLKLVYRADDMELIGAT